MASALASVLLVLSGATDRGARAQGFGFFQEGAAPRVRAPQRRRPPRPTAVAEPDAPLPVPRPHFSEDLSPPAANAGSAPGEPRVAAPISPMQEHVTQGADDGIPLPPPRPADLSAPTTPATPRVPDKPGPAPALAPPMPPASVGTGASPKAAVAPSGARLGEAPGQPMDDASCPGRLAARHVSIEPVSIGPQSDPRCTIVQAVRLTGMTLPDGRPVDFPDRPTIACTTADVFSLYVRDLLAPLAKGTYGAGVAAVWTGPGFECRSRDHIFGAKLSAHGQGLAIDIAQLKLDDNRLVEVGQPKTETDQRFEPAARAAGCGYFHTVLGPGSDSYHRTHWHFDLEVRGAQGDSKFCR